LNYLPHDKEVDIVLLPSDSGNQGRPRHGRKMARVAELTRNAFIAGDISTVMIS
jgi:cobaltochelatase CobS